MFPRERHAGKTTNWVTCSYGQEPLLPEQCVAGMPLTEIGRKPGGQQEASKTE